MRKEKLFFYTFFLFVILIWFIALDRLNYHLSVGLGDHLIVVAITAIVIVLFVLFFFGVFLSWWLVRLAQKKHSFLKRLTEMSPWIFSFLSPDSRDNLERVVIEKAEAQSASADEEMLAAIRKPKNRGRASNHPYETRRRTVLAWENRGPNFSYTLAEFLDERFGSSSTGIPNVPTDTFYYWRKQILDETRKREKERNLNA